MMGESLDKTLSDIVDGMERHRQLRQERVFSAFPACDPRRLLIDTIIGFAAALGRFSKTWRGRSVFAAGCPSVTVVQAIKRPIALRNPVRS
jgi:hypothetical protein